MLSHPWYHLNGLGIKVNTEDRKAIKYRHAKSTQLTDIFHGARCEGQVNVPSANEVLIWEIPCGPPTPHRNFFLIQRAFAHFLSHVLCVPRFIIWAMLCTFPGSLFEPCFTRSLPHYRSHALHVPCSLFEPLFCLKSHFLSDTSFSLSFCIFFFLSVSRSFCSSYSSFT